jgi:hypothetical protein
MGALFMTALQNIPWRTSKQEKLLKVRGKLGSVLGALDHLLVCFRTEGSVLSAFLEQRVLGDINDLSLKSSKSFASSVNSSAESARLNDAEDKLLGFLILYAKQLEGHARRLPAEFKSQRNLIRKLAIALRSVRITLSQRKEIMESLHQVHKQLSYN